MFLRQDARAERLRRVAVEHRHGGLGDDGASIHFRHDEMHRAAVVHHAVRQLAALVGMQALVGAGRSAGIGCSACARVH